MTTNDPHRARRFLTRCAAALAALALAVAYGGCEEGPPSEIQSYTDGAGRSCSVDLAEITLEATCDADASALVTCQAGQEPVFVLHDDYDFDTMIYTRQSCTACIDREARMTYIGTCSNVECAADMDCLNRDGDVTPFACTGGVCMK